MTENIFWYLKKIKLFALFIVVFLIIAVGVAGCNQIGQDTTASVTGHNQVVKEDASILTNYTDSEYNKLFGQEPFALFFHADWCPTCREIEKDVIADLDSFLEGTKILKANFDTETELKKEYGIVMQSMVVVFDKDGNVTEKLAIPTADDIKKAILASL